MRLLIHWIIDALIIFGVARFLPGVRLRSFGTALVVSLVLGVLGLVLGPILKVLASIAALPALVLTFGLFYFVIRFLVNTFLLWLTDKLIEGFEILDTGSLFLASAIISVLHHLVFRVF